MTSLDEPMNCRELDDRVTPYVDGLVSDDERRKIEVHLGKCPPCQRRARREQTARALVRERCRGFDQAGAPPLLRARCAALAGIEQLGRTPWTTRMVPLALAAGMVLVIGTVALYLLTGRSASLLAYQLTIDHVKCFALDGSEHMTGEQAQERLATYFDADIQVPQTAAADGLELVSARRCLYGDGRVAHILYRHAGRPVSLFVLPGATRAPDTVEVLGHESAIWSYHGKTFVLVSPESRAEIDHLATVVQAGVR